MYVCGDKSRRHESENVAENDKIDKPRVAS